MKKYLTLFIFILLLMPLNSACSYLIDPATQAQNYLRDGKFGEAIKVLEKEHNTKPESVPIKSLLARAYADYGLVLCQDEDKPPKVKYPMAKEQLGMALALNPYLSDAREMYEMIEKIQESFAANMLD